MSAARRGDVSALSVLFENSCLAIAVAFTAHAENDVADDNGNTADNSSERVDDRDIQQNSLLLATLQTMSEYASQTHEFRAMWTRVVDRVVHLHARVAKSRSLQRESAFQLAMLVFHLVQLKVLCSSSSIFARLVASSAISGQFRDIHTELGFLERATAKSSLDGSLESGAGSAISSSHAESRDAFQSNGSSDTTMNWELECSRDELALLEQFKAEIERWSLHESSDSARDANNESDEKEARSVREEAAFLLWHFVVVQGETCGRELRGLVDLSLQKVVNSVGEASELPAIPKWFIPPHELYIKVDDLNSGSSKNQEESEDEEETGSPLTITVPRGRWSKSTVVHMRMER